MTATDGRLARSARTRGKVVDALVDLLLEGVVDPDGRQIAERAGVSVRSIYVHFTSLEDLYEAVGERATARVLELLSPIDPTAALNDRIDSLCGQRARVNEEVGPLRRAAARREVASEALQQQRQFARRASRDQVARVFASELGPLEPRARRRRVATIDAAISGETWDLLRSVHRLSAHEATTATRENVRALLTAP